MLELVKSRDTSGRVMTSILSGEVVGGELPLSKNTIMHSHFHRMDTHANTVVSEPCQKRIPRKFQDRPPPDRSAENSLKRFTCMNSRMSAFRQMMTPLPTENKTIVLAERPSRGPISSTTFRPQTTPIQPVHDGQVLVRVDYLSIVCSVSLPSQFNI